MAFFHSPTGHVEWRIDRRNPQPPRRAADILLRTQRRTR